MNNQGWLLAFIAVIAVLGVVAGTQAQRKNGQEQPKGKRLMTDREQAMYNRLVETFPEHVPLSQVSLGALMTARTTATRNRFDRKIADFVLCNKAFSVLAVIELDDASHRSKGAKDNARDKLLNEAGYKTLRFKNVPDSADLKAALQALTACDVPQATSNREQPTSSRRPPRTSP